MNIDNIYSFALCGDSQLRLSKMAEDLMKEYLGCGIPPEDLYIICYNTVTVYFSAYKKNKKVFESPMDVMQKLSLEQIALLAKKSSNTQNVQIESGVNESFEEGVKCLNK